jgi:hypothetical protein
MLQYSFRRPDPFQTGSQCSGSCLCLIQPSVRAFRDVLQNSKEASGYKDSFYPDVTNCVVMNDPKVS